MERTHLDLSPAKWIWAPSGRTLPNTFVCFRRDFEVGEGLLSAEGYVLAGSRYVLSVNGQRVQFGPAPADPRFEEADTVNLTGFLREGVNTLGFRVVYFGNGDGTWVTGRAGLIFCIRLQYRDGHGELLVSDEETAAKFDESHPAGMYKRWYLRSLQEQYDARRDTVGFDTPEYEDKGLFEPSMVLPGRADKPSVMNGNTDYLFDSYPEDTEHAAIRGREIPLVREEFVPAAGLYHCGTVEWKRDPEDWFRFRHPNAFTIREGLEVTEKGNEYRFTMPKDRAAYLTFVLPEDSCGFIDFTIEAPEGTVIEAMVQEGHDKEKNLWLDTQFYAWTRFICREGENHFVSFDYECFSYLQLHIRNAVGEIVIKKPGVLRRLYPVKAQAEIATSDPKIQKVLEAGLNTLRNSAVETSVDGMARERQQYSGDCDHQIRAFAYLYGIDEPIVRRFYETYGDGMSREGYYLDCWPAYDRLNRVAQRQLGLTAWGPILDHGVQYVMSTLRYTRESGDSSILEKNYPNFLKQAEYFLSLRGEDGMISAENPGTGYIWLDHDAFLLEKDGRVFTMQRDKKCLFNLYVAAMLRDSMAPICRQFGDYDLADRYTQAAEELSRRVIDTYFDAVSGMFYDNLPHWQEDRGKYVSDRTLATALIFGFVPCDPQNMLKALAERPDFLRLSYPANAVWRYQALAKYGETAVLTEELRTRWFHMLSVQKNNTLQEMYEAVTDSNEELSHCPLSPILAVYEYYAGVKCEGDKFRKFSLRPHMGNLPDLSFTLRTVSGEIRFAYKDGGITVTFPPTMEGEVILEGERVMLESGKVYALPESQR